MLQSCNVSDRSDLQVIQNDSLRACYNIRCRDRVSISNLHTEAKLISLEQRRIIQLLSLMFIYKNVVNVESIALRNTRGANRFRFYTERYYVVKYKKSPYYKGAAL